jgi:hypothetical protein
VEEERAASAGEGFYEAAAIPPSNGLPDICVPCNVLHNWCCPLSIHPSSCLVCCPPACLRAPVDPTVVCLSACLAAGLPACLYRAIGPSACVGPLLLWLPHHQAECHNRGYCNQVPGHPHAHILHPHAHVSQAQSPFTHASSSAPSGLSLALIHSALQLPRCCVAKRLVTSHRWAPALALPAQWQRQPH